MKFRMEPLPDSRGDSVPEFENAKAIKTISAEIVPAVRPDRTCSIVMVSYKTGPVLLDSLKAALHQRGVSQVILVDNGNSEEMRRSIDDFARVDNRLEVVRGHGNVGFARGCNLGAKRARGRYLLLLNPDCLLGEDVIADSLAVFAEHRNCAMLTVRLLNDDGTEQRGGRRNLMTPWTCMVEQFRLDRLAPHHPHFQRFNLNESKPYTEVTEVQCISGAFMLMLRSVFDDVGGMDEDYFLHVEDVDFCMRLAKAKREVLYVPDISVTHVQGTSRVFPGFVEWHKSRSAVKYFYKHFQPQYPRAILNIVALAIFFRFALRLAPLSASWIMGRITGRTDSRRQGATPAVRRLSSRQSVPHPAQDGD
jgi:N-acetylglucosaminyl-diphospho-decaprenol L-rhamnosyltransferase